MITKLLGSLGEYKKYAIYTPILKFLETIFEVLIPYFMMKLIDVGVKNGDISYIIKTGLIMIGLALVSLILGALAGKTSALVGAGLSKNLRKEIFENVQTFSFSNLDKFPTSTLITRLTTDIANVQMAFQMILRLFVRAPVMIVVATIMSFTINAKLALVFICIIPFLGLGLYFLMTRAHPNFIKMFKKYDALNSVVQENLIGIRAVKSFVREENEIDKFQNSSGAIKHYANKAEKLLAFQNPIMLISMYACSLAIFWFGGNFIINGAMTEGQLTTFLSYIMQILSSLMMISMVFVMIIISRSSVERIYEMLKEKTNIVNPLNPVYEIKDGSIEFRDVSFEYKSNSKQPNYILKNINIKIESGQSVGIVGGTGSAKTTFVQLLPRLYDVSNGSCLIGGLDVREYDIEKLRDSVAMVLQKNVLFSGTIAENLRWGNEHATMDEMISACKTAQAHNFITTFEKGYDTYLEQGGVNLSGGQKQRLCIARALLKNPKVIIFDDSTSAVDMRTDALIRKELSKLKSEVTRIIIAQRVASVMDSDIIIVFDNGIIESVGKHEELLKISPVYSEMYYTQNSRSAENE